MRALLLLGLVCLSLHLVNAWTDDEVLRQLADRKAQQMRFTSLPSFRMGVSLSLTGGTTRVPLGQAIYRGLLFFESWYRNQSSNLPVITINGVAHELVLDIRDDVSNLNNMLQNYEDMADTADIFLGPVNSDFSIVLLPIWDGIKTVLLSSAAADSCSVGSQTFFSLLTPASSTFSSAFIQAKLVGATTYSYVTENSDYPATACGALPTSIGPESGLSLECNITVPSSLTGATNQSTLAYRNAIRQIRDHCQQDVLVLCGYPASGFVFLDELKSLNWLPKMVVVTPLLVDWDSNPNVLFMSGNTQWYQGVQYTTPDFYGSAQNFTSAYEGFWGIVPDSFDSFGAVAPILLLSAFETLPATDTDTLTYYLSRADFSSFFGRIVFNANHANLIDTVMVQYQPVGKEVVAPARAQEALLIYPMPNWDERSIKYGWFEYFGDYIMTIISAVLTLISIFFMGVTFYFRETDVMKAAQVEFVQLVLFGSILCYTSVYCWLFYVTDASCIALMWLLGTGFTIMLTALFFKTARVHFIFNNPELRTRRIPSWHILAAIFICLLLVWSLLIPWTIADPLQQKIDHPDQYRPSTDYAVCAMGGTGRGFLIAILVIEGVLLVLGAALAFLVRHVKLVLFNEAKWLGFSIYNFLILSAIAVGLLAGNTGGPESDFWIRTVIIDATCGIAVFCLMGPKLMFLRKGADRKTVSGTGTRGDSKSSSLATTLNMEEVPQLREEIARLKAKIAALESGHGR